MRLNASASARPCGRPAASASSRRWAANASRCPDSPAGSRFDSHRRAPLAAVTEQRVDLARERRVHVLDVVDDLRLEEQETVGPVRLDGLLREEMRVARGNDTVDRQPARLVVIRVEAVALPRVVTEQDLRPDPANRLADRGALGSRPLELPVDEPEEVHGARTERRRGGTLLVLASRHEGGRVLARVPRSLRAVGEDEQLHVGARRGPLRERRPAPELDVVRMGADRQRRNRHREIE